MTNKFTARKDVQHNPPERCTEALYGYTMWTVFVDDPYFPYSLGYIRQDHGTGERPVGCTVFNLSRSDIGMRGGESVTFPTMAEATAYVRETYERADAAYHARIAEVFGLLRQGLSTVEQTDPRYAAEHIVLGIIDCEGRHTCSHAIVTAQEALTALDWLHERSEGRYVPTIEGRVVPGQTPVLHRCGFAEWRIPLGSSDYHLEGWRSTTGRGRARYLEAATAAHVAAWNALQASRR